MNKYVNQMPSPEGMGNGVLSIKRIYVCIVIVYHKYRNLYDLVRNSAKEFHL